MYVNTNIISQQTHTMIEVEVYSVNKWHFESWTKNVVGKKISRAAPQKKIGARLRARYVRSAHMFAQKKNRTPAIQKNRLALRAPYVRYAHMFAPP